MFYLWLLQLATVFRTPIFFSPHLGFYWCRKNDRKENEAIFLFPWIEYSLNKRYERLKNISQRDILKINYFINRFWILAGKLNSILMFEWKMYKSPMDESILDKCKHLRPVNGYVIIRFLMDNSSIERGGNRHCS